MTPSSTVTPPSSTQAVPDRSGPGYQIAIDGPTRVGIVGAGYIAEFHLALLAEIPDAKVVCVCDPVLEKAQGIARRFQVPNAVAELSELVDHGVQVAHLLVPPGLHERLTEELLELGIGVFVEKPLALESAAAERLGEIARKRQLPLGVNHNAVHFPSFAKLLERVRAGEIGRVEHVQLTLSVPLRQLDAGDFAHWMFQAPRNIVFEQGPHPFAQLNELIGAVQECNVTKLGTRELLPGQIFHDRWLAAARGERGTAEIYLAFGQDFTRSTIQVLGTDGSLQADVFHNHIEIERKGKWLDFWNTYAAGAERAKELKRSARKVLFQYFGQTLGLTRREDGFFAGMRGSIQAFHRALRSNSPVPADATRGAEVLQWCEAVTEGVSGEAVQRPPLPAPCPPRSGEVLVLGATGFIGRRTVEALLECGRPVSALIRRTHSLPPLLEEAARDGRVRLLRGSLEDTESLEAALEGVECVVHLATGGGATWEDIEKGMIRGSERFARAAIKQGVKRFIYVSSTAALYLGSDCGTPVLRDSLEADPQPEKRAMYARGKIRAERALIELYKNEGLPLIIARPGIVLGDGTPMQHSGVGLWVRDNHCVGWGHGERPLPLVLADDVAKALAAAADYKGDDLNGRAMNLAGRVPLTAQQMVAAMRERTERDLHFHSRGLGVSQTMELGKWLVKKAGRQKNAEFPSWRDLKSREMWPELACDTARELLGWEPVEDPDHFLEVALAGAVRRAPDSE